jgi:hypothetical protein
MYKKQMELIQKLLKFVSAGNLVITKVVAVHLEEKNLITVIIIILKMTMALLENIVNMD